MAALAVRIARASASARRAPVRARRAAGGPRQLRRRRYENDPFAISDRGQGRRLLLRPSGHGPRQGVAFTEASLHGAARVEGVRRLATAPRPSRSSPTSGPRIEANAVDGDELQRRTYPDAGGAPAAGYEYIRGLDLAGHAERLAEEAVELLSAPQCPPGRRTIILDPSQLYLQLHESCGHPTELDRVFGTEASYAGTSFLTTDKLDEASATARSSSHRRRRHGAGRHGHLRLGRRGRRRRSGAAGQGRHLRGLPVEPRDGAAHRPPSGGAMRADGWNRCRSSA